MSCTTLPPGEAAPPLAPKEAVESSKPSTRDPLRVDRAALDEFIDSVFGATGNNGPGAAVIVMHDGRVVTQRQYGMASLEHGVPFTPNHAVRLPYSEGREFIAIAATFMEHDGLIGLDDSVRGHFPRLPVWSDPVTIRDLIHHRSGFVDEWSVLLLMHGSMSNRFDESQFLRLLYDQPAPEVEPGAGYMYSNSDYGLLRLILEKAASKDLSGYMKRRMFEPLQMNATRLVDDFSKVIPQMAAFYAPDGDGYRHSDVKTSPGGNYVIVTTACDLGRWAHAHSDQSSEVSRAIDRLSRGAEPVPGLDGHFAFGHTVSDVAGMQVVRHEGVLGCTYLSRIPERGLAVVTFCNRYYEPAENRAVVDFLLDPDAEKSELRIPTEAVAVTGEELARYTGRFVSTNTPSWESRMQARELIRINVVDGALQVGLPWGRFPLVPVGEGIFSWHGDSAPDDWGMLLEFGGKDGDGPLHLLIRYDDGSPSSEYARLADWAPSPARLRRVAGTYHSAHLDYSWTVMIDEAGELILRAPTMADIRVDPYQENEFLLRHEKFPDAPFHVWIRFHENEAGEITHLTVWNPRLMHHRFDRR